MRAYKRLCLAFIFIYIILFSIVNITFIYRNAAESGSYRVEAKRLRDEIIKTGDYTPANYPHITGVFTSDDELFTSDNHYLIIEADNTLYRVEYKLDDNNKICLTINIVLCVIFVISSGFLFYIYREIIKPFNKLNNVSKELARGNLSTPIPEQKSRYFSGFTWGINLLRESIETSREKEMTLKRDKQLLLLSLSHDIKTPLAAIKLSAKALSGGLYKDEDKKISVAKSIGKRADEIEGYVRDITAASDNELMAFEVEVGEVFLSDIISRISERYSLQLLDSGVEFNIHKYDDSLVLCDSDRLTECIQNLMENAIKYGDGGHIEISFDRVDSCVLITVSNSGCTLNAAELPQLYESFHRGLNAQKIPGNGMGLYICRRLMLLMGGDIYADIRNGLFYITLVVRLA